uniref:Uncharacterized protein n=1 Tax=Eutreptiella gymnastica TaxID=73025 RepID=A0A7S1NCG7_9EUGL|mmetsp:Transcript_17085/g.30497  ORF Transcript_17085/g.30497 Transcript_17085/m.30497 type:complete len:108 (+) Transcript_17085:736-1059(+)
MRLRHRHQRWLELGQTGFAQKVIPRVHNPWKPVLVAAVCLPVQCGSKHTRLHPTDTQPTAGVTYCACIHTYMNMYVCSHTYTRMVMDLVAVTHTHRHTRTHKQQSRN